MKQTFISVALPLLLHRAHACIQHVAHIASVEETRAYLSKRSEPPPIKKTAIQNVRVFDGNEFTDPQTIFLDGGLIVDCLSSVDTVVNGTGQFLIPGLMDAHVHITTVPGLENFTSYGATTALNMHCSDYAACSALKNLTGLASYFTSGPGLTSANASHFNLSPPTPDSILAPNEDPQELVSWVFGNGSDFMKFAATENGITQNQMNDIVAETHNKYNAKTMTHTGDYATYLQAVASGTDGLQHIPDNGLLNQTTFDSILAQNQFNTPTMNIYQIGYKDPTIAALFGRPFNSTTQNYGIVVQNVGALHKAGVLLLTGTDAVGPVSISSNITVDVPFGLTLQWELRNLVSAGMQPEEALRAATSEIAYWHGLEDRGSIRPGLRADLVLLDSDSLANISNVGDIAQIWVGGVEVQKVTRSI